MCAWARVSAAPRHSWLGRWGVCVLVCALRLYPATPGWGVRCGCVCLGLGFGCAPPLLAGVLGCACLCVRSACTPTLLAWPCGVGVCAPARALAGPRHSWLGCASRLCVLGLGFRLRSATPGWGVGLCVCLCARSGCTPPSLVRVCGVGVCAWARVLAAPGDSLLGCWGVCVLVCALRLYPATPGWGVRCGCVCLGSGFGCAPPLLAGVSSVGVCAWARVSAVPRHSWLGCWGVCVPVCALRLYPATPGWGVRCGCVCLCSGFGCATQLPAGVLGLCVCLCARSACTSPLLAGVCGVGVCAWARVSAGPRRFWQGCWGVRVCVRALLVPRHSWLGCAVWVCVLGLEFWLRPATPGWGAGVCVCLCVRSACTPPLLAGLCGVGVCAWALVSAAPRHSWLGCWGVRVCVCAPLVPRHSWLGRAVWACVLGFRFRLRPATRGWGVQCGCVCLGSGFGSAPPLLAGVLPCVCACVRSTWTPPLLVGVRGMGVCAWARVSAAPRDSWLGCWGSVCACVRAPVVPRHAWLGRAVSACVLGLGFWLRPTTPGSGIGVCVFVCALCLYSAPPCWGVRCGCVCLGSGFGCAPPLLAGVLGCVCACACAPLVPGNSWLGCWGVCVCLCVRSACTPPLLAGLCSVGVCAWARVWAASRHSLLGCWGVCVLVCALRLYPATPGWGVWCGRVCLGSGFGCAPPLLAGVCSVGVCAWARVSAAPRHSWLGCWGVCVPVCALRLHPATPGWGVRCGCVCLCLGFGCATQLPAGMLGFCVCLCARSACTSPLLAGMCGVGVCAWARVSAAPRSFWQGCRGVRVCVRALLVPRHSWLGCAVWAC